MYNKTKMIGVDEMSTKLFTKEEMEMLAANKYVKHVSAKGITYTDEFRRIFISEHGKGRFPRAIFEECGFVISILGIGRVESLSKDWRAKYKKNGILGLQDTRRGRPGRPSDKKLSIEEDNERLKTQNKLLKAENELLKKLDMLERGMRKRK
jgi:transposase